ncbi:hypothetical protein CB0940_02583 [Cercospora beticola]|uniref:Actin-like ATPase domain-containing protein n=1 Tax=Cercospora beticola TaxID=122368 RepID=A0A2G5I3N6_CERBT|nr:hypothetical protein CB0940_02583 [Cercospora beticola]PIA99361.1 hypothetical protein CB0940_02583 [Cercospora beticola]WPA99725.1 hypothetical protein RHO25_004344 [Cercospora beticola]
MVSKAQRPKRKRNANINAQSENEYPATNRDQTTSKRKRNVKIPPDNECPTTYHDQIDLAIDWGTWKFVVAYVLSRDGVRNAPAPLMINEQTYEVRMMATWIDGRFVHGHELQNEATMKSDLKIIDFPKLPLYQGPETSDITKRVMDTLAELPGNKTLDLLIQEHLRAIVEDAKSALRKTDLKVHYRDDPKQLEELLNNMHVRITIPQMWTPDAKRRMQTAAKNAGLRVSVLSYEPQCALAYLIDAAAKQIVRVGQLYEGDSILVADLGCGTGDFVLYELQSKLGVDSRLQCMRQSSGEICGSFKVDEALLRILKLRRTEWYENTRRQLNIEPREFERRVLIAIEEAKQKFSRNDQNHTTCTIEGIGGEYKTFQFKRTEFHEAFDEVIAKIIEQIEKTAWGERPTVIQVTGGFSKCRYLMEALRNRFEPDSLVVRPNETDTADCFPVALGALLRYENITMPALPSKYGYALLQRQPFHEDVHTDAYVDEEGWQGELERIPMPWLEREPYGRDFDVVDHRIVNIISKDQILRPNQVVRHRREQLYTVPCDDPRLTDELCYLTTTVKDDEWAKTEETDDNGEFMWRPGVHFWTSVNVPLDRRRLDGKGFEEIEENGKKFWELLVRVTLRYCEIDVKIGYEILKPAGWVECNAGVKDEEGLPEDMAFRARETLWEASHSDFVS